MLILQSIDHFPKLIRASIVVVLGALKKASCCFVEKNGNLVVPLQQSLDKQILQTANESSETVKSFIMQSSDNALGPSFDQIWLGLPSFPKGGRSQRAS